MTEPRCYDCIYEYYAGSIPECSLNRRHGTPCADFRRDEGILFEKLPEKRRKESKNTRLNEKLRKRRRG